MTTVKTNGLEGPYAAVADPVIERMTRETVEARGLPNEAFTDPQFLALERKHLFSRTWTFAGVISDVPNTGDVKSITVAGRSLFMATDANGTTRVYHNVCPHRGVRLVIEDKTDAIALTCPYHAWSFGLDGSLRGRPHFHGPEDHDHGGNGASDVCLFEVRSAVWNDWVFVNLDGEAPPFETYMAPVMERYRSWNLDGFRRAHYQAYAFHCNWKLAIENFCDNYHVFAVHPRPARHADAPRPISDAARRQPHVQQVCHGRRRQRSDD